MKISGIILGLEKNVWKRFARETTRLTDAFMEYVSSVSIDSILYF